eukprot:396256_1
MALKKQKEEEHEARIQKQQQMEIAKQKEAKRLEKEEKLRRLQKQIQLKEIENNKLKLAQLHHKKALMVYYGWIPWMQRIELNNINFHRTVLIRNNSLQKRMWRSWLSVLHRRKLTKANAQKAATAGREMVSNRLFAIK